MARPHPLAFALALALLASPTLAKKDDPGTGKGHGGHGTGDVVVVDAAIFTSDQRVVFREYWGERYGRKCPPGLAKKNDGCMPPGLAKKRYRVGHAPPQGVVVAPLPPELKVRIGVPPVGYLYGMIDGDLVKLAAGTYLVVDALDGLTE